MKIALRHGLVAMLFLLAGCVTINVYFPAAAAQKAADQFVGSLIQQQKAATQSAPSSSSPVVPAPSASVERPDTASMLAVVMNFLVEPARAASVNLRVNTPEISAIHARMGKRLRGELGQLLDAGAVGFTHDGLVAVRDASAIPLAKRAVANKLVSDANRDRKALYAAIAKANGHPEWAGKIQATFAKTWISKARSGWYVQRQAGKWSRK